MKNIFIISFSFLFFLLHTSGVMAYERIVVLYSAISPILKQLGVDEKVVAVTRTDEVFTDLPKVGSHLRPNIELIKVLKPDLILAGSKRAFPENLKEKIPVPVYHYDPRTIEEVLEKITEISRLFGKERASEKLIAELKEKLSVVVIPEKRPTVIFEVSERSLKVSGRRSIITSIIEKAGGVNLIDVKKKHVLISPEKVIKLNPDFYIYQEGPMNKNPGNPLKRPFFKPLKSKAIRVKEIEFSRPGINVFDAVVKLNRIFLKEYVSDASIP